MCTPCLCVCVCLMDKAPRPWHPSFWQAWWTEQLCGRRERRREAASSLNHPMTVWQWWMIEDVLSPSLSLSLLSGPLLSLPISLIPSSHSQTLTLVIPSQIRWRESSDLSCQRQGGLAVKNPEWSHGLAPLAVLLFFSLFYFFFCSLKKKRKVNFFSPLFIIPWSKPNMLKAA